MANEGAAVQFLTLDEVLAIHSRLLARFGGATGVRDLGLLESAIYRPQTGYYEDLVAMATALFESLIRNRPFVDGNKRVAFFATDTFLRLNGWWIQVEPAPAYTFLMELLETHRCNFDHLEPWLRSNVRRLDR